MFLNLLLSTALIGSWKQDCLSGRVRFEYFSKDTVQYSEIYYNEVNCKTPSLVIEMNGNYQVNNSEMDFQFTETFVTLKNAQVADNFNSRSVCGKSDWHLDVPRPVTGLNCDFFNWGRNYQVPNSGDQRFGIWKVENDRLYFGLLTSINDALHPSRRPNEWDPRFYVKIKE